MMALVIILESSTSQLKERENSEEEPDTIVGTQSQCNGFPGQSFLSKINRIVTYHSARYKQC